MLPGLPLAFAQHIVSDPLALSAFVYAGQFFVLYFCLAGLLISSA